MVTAKNKFKRFLLVFTICTVFLSSCTEHNAGTENIDAIQITFYEDRDSHVEQDAITVEITDPTTIETLISHLDNTLTNVEATSRPMLFPYYKLYYTYQGEEYIYHINDYFVICGGILDLGNYYITDENNSLYHEIDTLFNNTAP